MWEQELKAKLHVLQVELEQSREVGVAMAENLERMLMAEMNKLAEVQLAKESEIAELKEQVAASPDKLCCSCWPPQIELPKSNQFDQQKFHLVFFVCGLSHVAPLGQVWRRQSECTFGPRPELFHNQFYAHQRRGTGSFVTAEDRRGKRVQRRLAGLCVCVCL